MDGVELRAEQPEKGGTLKKQRYDWRRREEEEEEKEEMVRQGILKKKGRGRI